GIPILRGEVTAVRSFLMGQGFVLHGDCGEIGASCVIASTGTDPVRLGTPGAREAEGTRLFYDVRGLLAAYKTPARVLVVGGGEAALDSALSVACVGARVRILVRAEKLRARGRLTDVVEHNPAIQITPRVTVRHIRCAESGIELEVTGPNGTGTEAADALLVAIGRRSNVGSLFPEPIIDSGKPDKTTVPGLFVAGDAASGSLGQVGMAVGDGLAAAMAAVAALSE
ncbi:MAG: NAD(P)/FAD-dependent oxidoreductase, partial [Candidatus Eisenbacteria sp.]|nr:NAD(P)/FAD-dependent oxidoreductase [Candidatus Eisenbacteria bacterium]